MEKLAFPCGVLGATVHDFRGSIEGLRGEQRNFASAWEVGRDLKYVHAATGEKRHAEEFRLCAYTALLAA